MLFWPFVNCLYRQAFVGVRFSLGFGVCFVGFLTPQGDFFSVQFLLF